jgi:hypothetical protein
MFEFASSLSTVGLSVGVTAADAPAGVLWTEMAAMFLGRLEFFAIIVGLIKLTGDVRTLAVSGFQRRLATSQMARAHRRDQDLSDAEGTSQAVGESRSGRSSVSADGGTETTLQLGQESADPKLGTPAERGDMSDAREEGET